MHFSERAALHNPQTAFFGGLENLISVATFDRMNTTTTTNLIRCRICGVEKSCGSCFEPTTLFSERDAQGRRSAWCHECYAKQSGANVQSVSAEFRVELEEARRAQGIAETENEMGKKRFTQAQLANMRKQAGLPAPMLKKPQIGPQNGVEHLHNILKGRHLFLLCGGPSLASLNLEALNQRGIVTMAINNTVANFRPNYFIAVDKPERFVEQAWKDPGVCKLIPRGLETQHISKRDESGVLGVSAFTAEQCPNVFGFEIRENFDPDTFLSAPGFCSGTSSGLTDKIGVTGARTTMLAALKMAFYMGAKNVYLLGCDFQMSEGRGYAHEQDVTAEYAKSNNRTYSDTAKRFAALIPHFQVSGFNVYNCNLESHLRVFPFLRFEDAVEIASRECNEKPIQTEGMYPRSLVRAPKTLAVPKTEDGALVFNDTLSDSHYGCLAVMNSLAQVLKGAGVPFTDSVSVRHSSNVLACEGIHDKIARAKVVVVNGEGSMHHSNARAMGLARIARMAKGWGKPSALVNATLYNNNEAFYEELREFGVVFVRDVASLENLKARNIPARWAPDLTFFSDLSGEIPLINVPRVGDSVLSDITQKLGALAAERGWQQRSIHYSGAPTGHTAYVEAHRRAGFVVTGRFHDVCFCLNARVPFVAVESNTNKIEALLHDVFGETRRLLALGELSDLDPSDWVYTDDEKTRLDRYLSEGRTAFSEMQMALRGLFLSATN